MKRIHNKIFIVAALTLLGIIIAGCGRKKNDNSSAVTYTCVADLEGKSIAVGTGSAQEAILEKEYPGITLMRMDNEPDMLQALRSNLCDGVVSDGHIIKFLIQGNKDIAILDYTLNSFPMGAGFVKGSELKEPFDEFIRKIKEDGTYDKMYDRWINNALSAKMPEFNFDHSKEPLKIATFSVSPPLSFIQNGKLAGFEIEMGYRFGEYLGRPVEWSDMYFSGVIPSLVSGSQDMAMCGISITEERAKSIDFSESYFSCDVKLCVRRENSPLRDNQIYTSLEDLADKKVATYTGSSQERSLARKYPQMQLLLLDDDIDIVNALVSGKCEAVVIDDYALNYYSKLLGGVEVIDSYDKLAFGAIFQKEKNSGLRREFNSFIKKIKRDGTHEEMMERWIKDPDNAVMPELEMPQEGKPIMISISSGPAPFQFFRDGELTGFEVELCKRFGQYVNRPIVFNDTDWSSIVTSVAAGTDDMAIAALDISSDRSEAVDFSDPYFNCKSLVGVRVENAAHYTGEEDDSKEDDSFFESLKTSFRRNIIEEDRYKLILSGLKITTFISIMSGILGTLLGALICWMNMHRNRAMKAFATVYISAMRGTPVLVFLMLMFYVILAGTSLNAVWVSIITFAMNFSAYTAEMFRTTIEGIDRGQTEAGLSLGYTPTQTFIKFILPQAFKQVLPVYKGEIISLVKETSIVGYIAVQDLTKVGDIIRSRTFDAFFPLIMVAVLYFVLAWIFAAVLDSIGPKKK